MFRPMAVAMVAVLATGLVVTACSDTGSTTGPSPVPPSTPPGAPASGNAILRVRCQASGGRSKISIDGKNLSTGDYRASVRSGGNTAVSESRRTVGDEVEFEFDSDPDDVAAGAVAISPTFIQGGRVDAMLSTAAGQAIASSGASCS